AGDEIRREGEDAVLAARHLPARPGIRRPGNPRVSRHGAGRSRSGPERIPVGLFHAGRHPRPARDLRPDLDPHHDEPGRHQGPDRAGDLPGPAPGPVLAFPRHRLDRHLLRRVPSGNPVMGPSPEDTDRGPRSQLTDIGRSLRSHLTNTGRSLRSHLADTGRALASHLGRIGRELPGQLRHIGRGLLSLLTHIGRGLRSGLVGANRSLRSYLAGIDRDLRPYLTGFALALILTAIPFALVAFKPLPTPPTLIIIGVAAAIQVLVHLRYFLH